MIEKLNTDFIYNKLLRNDFYGLKMTFKCGDKDIEISFDKAEKGLSVMQMLSHGDSIYAAFPPNYSEMFRSLCLIPMRCKVTQDESR